jgi:phosphate transport system protein
MITLEKEIMNIRTEIAKMSGIAMDMIKNSIEALVKRDIECVHNTIKMDDEVDKLEVFIEEKCLEVLALYEPKARDLRFVIAALRIIIDIERIGDLATSICKQVKILSEIPPVKPYEDLPRMTNKVTEMLSDAISSYFIKNDHLAKSVIERDDEIDDLNIKIIKELIEITKDNPEKVEAAISLMIISKNLERIADHCTNIAELVIFMDTAKIIKHEKQITD